MESYHIIIIAIAVFGSAVIKNSVGIGAGVFLMPFLTLILPPKVALGLGAPAMLISDLVGIKNYWGEWDKRELAFLLPPAIIGVVLGGLLVQAVSDRSFKLFVGAVALIFSLYHLVKIKYPGDNSAGWLNISGKTSDKLSILFGFLGGTASTLIHAGGMVMSIYLINRLPTKRGFVATLVLFFAIINLSKWIAYTRIGILTWDVAIIVWMLSPLIILGGFIGNIINQKLQYSLFKVIVLVLILIIGFRLLMTA
jgi:hypothetical protein